MSYLTDHAGRVGDMHPTMSLRLELAADGDIAVYIEEEGVPIRDEKNQARVEFCSPADGGGRSLHTRRALYALFEAMKKDAKERPDAIPAYPHGLKEHMLKESGT